MGAIRTISTAILVLAAVACGQPAATVSEAQAQPTTAAAPAAISAADRTAILRMLNLTANARGQVRNECDDMVTPQFITVELGGAVGTAVLFAIGGGPSMAGCYGDGPGLTLFKREGAAFRPMDLGKFLADLAWWGQHHGVDVSGLIRDFLERVRAVRPDSALPSAPDRCVVSPEACRPTDPCSRPGLGFPGDPPGR